MDGLGSEDESVTIFVYRRLGEVFEHTSPKGFGRRGELKGWDALQSTSTRQVEPRVGDEGGEGA